jgi:hypothetical protein
VANNVGADIYDTALNVFIKANASSDINIAQSYSYLINHGLYEDCEFQFGIERDSSYYLMNVSLAHMKDPSGTNEFQVVYVSVEEVAYDSTDELSSYVSFAEKLSSNGPVTRESLLADDIATDLDFNINNRASATAWLTASFSGNVSTTPMSQTLLHTTVTMNGDTMQALYGLKPRCVFNFLFISCIMYHVILATMLGLCMLDTRITDSFRTLLNSRTAHSRIQILHLHLRTVLEL